MNFRKSQPIFFFQKKFLQALSAESIQCLESWFSWQENAWIIVTSSQDLDNYSWLNMQDFARFFNIIERNPRKFMDFMAKNLKLC